MQIICTRVRFVMLVFLALLVHVPRNPDEIEEVASKKEARARRLSLASCS